MTTSKKDKHKPPASVQNFPIVGIGASAGGLDAFKRLLKAIPDDSGMAYVLVQHLDPSHESILPEILSRTTNIPVHEVTDDIKLAPDHIYIIPSNKILISTDGVLKLATRDKKRLNFTIDIFFNSIAEVHQSFAIGVVLSGTGSDGTLGLKAIKEHGGITFVQDSASAAYDSMPQSAVNAGVVDFILSPEKIPAQLLAINSTYKTVHAETEDDNPLPIPKDDEEIFKQILALLNQRSGVDFTYYKQPTLRRRIARRMAIGKKMNLADYLKFLRTDKAEQDALFQDVLIPVTSFFRDSKTFQTLGDTVFPSLFKNKSPDEPFRIWIAGCSTGEEAYSIAICLHEFLGEKLSYTRIQIFASDISESVIKKARRGYYSKVDVEKLSEAYIKKYFIKSNGGYEVSKLIRDMCVFAAHNFLKDPPFAKMDLISCRNVLIYLDPFLQKKALTTFHYALKENGFLLLGKSETTGSASELFTHLTKHDKIYSRKPVPGRFMHIATERKEKSLAQKKIASKPEATQTDFRKSAESILLSKFTPASVVVNDAMDIVHIHGIITPFLIQPQGTPSFNLLKMAREGLGFELRNALHKAKISNETVVKENIPIEIQGKPSLVTIRVMPLSDTVEPHFLILFEEKVMPVLEQEKKSSFGEDAHKRIEQLEKELTQTREDMRSITEDMEATNEELQSANEELQSGNEEMQSLNEELETSREEIQSTNEELTIINHELLDKQQQLNAARSYAEAIVTSVRDPLVILDKSMHIVTANASFYKKFQAEELETEGKLFYEIQNNQWDDWVMRTLLGKILPKKERLTDFEIILTFPKIGERTMLMNAQQIVNEKTAEQLILLAIEDITDRVLADKKIENAKKVAEDALQSKQQFLANMSHEIRTPMNAIIGFTKVVLKTDLSKKQIEYLNAIKTSGDTLIVLIDDILDLAKVDAGKMTFVQKPFELSVSVSTMLHLFETKIKEKNLELITQYDSKIPTVLLGDAARLHQIILNLVSNAVKFTSKGNIVVSVDLLNEDANQATIRFAIEDSGIGIAENQMLTIFEKFQQANHETSSLYGGTGLGLAIAKQLVEKQGGTIDVKSKIGEGSTFSFTLSFEKTKAEVAFETEIMVLDTEMKAIKVLIAEDVALNQFLIRTILDDFGFSWDIAANGKIVLEKLKTHVYDIILMDLQMPEMNGFEATEYIRKTMKSNIPIIALTANVTKVDVEKCKTVGMNDYITKPIDEKSLYQKIMGLLKH